MLYTRGHKTFFIKTFGCQMNVYDSILISEKIKELGYIETNDIKKADLILINTCAVRKLAEHKALSELGATKKLKEKNPNILIGIIGCIAQKLGKKIISLFPFVDFVLGTKEMYKIPFYLENLEKTNRLESLNIHNSVVKLSLNEKVEGYKTEHINSVSAFITIVRGCNNFCTYCIVPFVRGREESRKLGEILEEINNMAYNGVKEIVLLGQNVNVFGKDNNENLETLLYKINEIEGIERIRYFTSHPKDVTENFIKNIKDIKKVCEHIHIPFQSGSNRILKMMNRKYTREEYIEKIQMIREYIPNVSITTDVIVGFPSETKNDFQDTLDLLESCQIDSIYSFKYSPREGTIAYKNFIDDVSISEKENRLKVLNELSNKISLRCNNKYISTIQEILWENIVENAEFFIYEGRTRSYKKVFLTLHNKEIKLGEISKVKISGASIFSLYGETIKGV